MKPIIRADIVDELRDVSSVGDLLELLEKYPTRIYACINFTIDWRPVEMGGDFFVDAEGIKVEP